jgi:uncharacterized membrane protein (DUF106 family)
MVNNWPAYVFRVEVLVFVIPIVAILVGGIVGLTKLLLRHRERMAMIQRGMHPDQPEGQDKPQEVP